MTRLVRIAIAATVLMGAPLSLAHAWERNTTITGPHGTTSSTTSGTCTGGVCSRSLTWTGPYGGTATRTSPSVTIGSRSATSSCGGGTCTRNVTRSGTYGRSVTRSVTR